MTKNTPTISVIVPVYNAEKYLARCLDSVINQTFTDFELVLVNDAASDNSPQICNDYARKDKRIKVVHHKKNLGVARARNTGLYRSQGDYISFVDSDDWIDANYLEVLFKSAQETNSDLAICPYRRVAPKGNTSAKNKTQKLTRLRTIYSREETLIDLFTKGKTISHGPCGKLYRASLYSGLRYPEGFVYEDILTTFKLVSKANQVCYTEGTVYNYFQSEESITRGKFNLNRLSFISNYREAGRQLLEEGLQLQEEATYSLFRLITYLIDEMLLDNSVKLQRRGLIRQLSAMRQELSNNKYMTVKDRTSILLSRSPLGYELVKHAISLPGKVLR